MGYKTDGFQETDANVDRSWVLRPEPILDFHADVIMQIGAKAKMTGMLISRIFKELRYAIENVDIIAGLPQCSPHHPTNYQLVWNRPSPNNME